MITDALESILTQHQRLFTFDSPLPPEQELQLLSFSGREGISELFSFQCSLSPRCAHRAQEAHRQESDGRDRHG